MPHRWRSIWRCWSPRLACSHSLRCYSENATVKLDHNPRDENQKIDEYHQPRWWLLTIYTVHHCFQDSFLLSWSIILISLISWYSGTPWSKKTIVHHSGEPMDLTGRSPQLSVFTCEVLWGCYQSPKSQDAQHSENMKHHEIYRIGVFPSIFEGFPYSKIWSTQGEVRLLQFVLVYLSVKPNLPKYSKTSRGAKTVLPKFWRYDGISSFNHGMISFNDAAKARYVPFLCNLLFPHQMSWTEPSHVATWNHHYFVLLWECVASWTLVGTNNLRNL